MDPIAHEPAPGMTVVADAARKTLRVNFGGRVTPAIVEAHARSVGTEVQRLGAGFTMVSDLTELESMDIDCVPYVTRIMDLCFAAGIGKVVRIIPDPDKDIGMNLLSIVHYRGKVPTITVESRADAEQVLKSG